MPSPELNKEQVDATIQQLSMLVVAHREAFLRSVFPQMLKHRLGNELLTAKLEGDMDLRFSKLAKLPKGYLPLIECADGFELERVVQLAGEQDLENGLYISSYTLGNGPTSSRIFANQGKKLPQNNTRVLVTGGPAINYQGELKEGNFDSIISIPQDSVDDFRAKVAQAILEKRPK